jgi:hypothetical protein
MAGTPPTANQGELALYFALGFAAALLLVGIAMGLKAFGFWRLKHARMNDRIRCARVTGAALIAETVVVAQGMNLLFAGARWANYQQMGWFFDRLLPTSTSAIITALLAMVIFASIALLRGEFAQAMDELGELLRKRIAGPNGTGTVPAPPQPSTGRRGNRRVQG